MKALLAMLILVAALALLPACEDDPVTPPPVEPVLAHQPLTSRKAVLNNIEYAYMTRRGDVLDELLDDNFVFYFAPGDVGGEIPPSWERDVEFETTRALFESNTWSFPLGPICRSIRVDLQLDDTLDWTPMVPASAPTETWYHTTTYYSFAFEMEPDITFIAHGARAQFTVRQVGDQWRLVEWHDLGSSIVTASNGAEVGQATTWGGIKALYR